MQRYLITTADESTWVFDRPVLFLGKWCLLSRREHIWSKLDYEIIPYHWENCAEMRKDASRVIVVYENLISELAETLNKKHDLNWSTRAWRIVIGPWLKRYVEIILDRWKSIQNALTSYELTGVSVGEPVWNEIIAKDFDEFGEFSKTDLWNYYIYSELLMISADLELNTMNPNVRIDTETNIENDVLVNEAIITKIKSYFFSFAKKLLHSKFYQKFAMSIARNNDYYLYNTYIHGKKNILKLSALLGDWPILTLDHPVPDMEKVKYGKRLCLKYESHRYENFEKIVKYFLPKLMPTIYLEGFKNLLECTKTAGFPKRTKSIITTIGIWKDEAFKVWVAQSIQQGTKLIVGQHGGEYGTSLFSTFEEHEQSISDKYLTWGWGKDSEKNLISPVPNLIGKKNCDWNKDGKIAVILSENARYLSQMSPNLFLGKKSDEYISQIDLLLNLLSDEFKDILSVKLFPNDYERGMPLGDILKKSFPDINFLPLKSSFEKLMINSRLSIHTYDGTTFLEEIGVGRPCMSMFAPKLNPLRNSAQPFFDKLEEVGIHHKSPDSAANKINEISEHVDLWWNSSDVIEARKVFCKEFAFTIDDPLKYLRDIILSN